LVVTGSSIPRLKPNPLLILLKNGISHNILILPPTGRRKSERSFIAYFLNFPRRKPRVGPQRNDPGARTKLVL
jgi:hypothetical protein